MISKNQIKNKNKKFIVKIKSFYYPGINNNPMSSKTTSTPSDFISKIKIKQLWYNWKIKYTYNFYNIILIIIL